MIVINKTLVMQGEESLWHCVYVRVCLGGTGGWGRDHTHANDAAGLIMQKKKCQETFYKCSERPRGAHTHTHTCCTLGWCLLCSVCKCLGADIDPPNSAFASAFPVCRPAFLLHTGSVSCCTWNLFDWGEEGGEDSAALRLQRSTVPFVLW